VKHETQRLGGAVRRQSRHQASSPMDADVSRTAAVAGSEAKKQTGDRGASAAVVPVVRAIWRDAQGTRLRLTYVTRGTVDFENLDTGGHGVISRAWLEKHFTPLS
jgi:hypothetical protein